MAAEMFLSAVISLLTNKAADLVLGEFRTARSVEKYCQKLYRILPAVQAVVENAEERSRAEPAVREWVHSLKAAAHEAEDVLDELKYNSIRKAIQTEIQENDPVEQTSLTLLVRDGKKTEIQENDPVYNLFSLERWQENDPVEQTSLTFPQIRKLSIENCHKLDVLPSCPLIENLFLSGLHNLKHICYSGSTQLVPMFPMLQMLDLSHLSSLEKWQENDPAERTSLILPQLCSLTILSCPGLDALPSCPMLGELKIVERTNIPSSVIESFKNKGFPVYC